MKARVALFAVSGLAAFALLRGRPDGMIWIPGGEFAMGTDGALGRPEAAASSTASPASGSSGRSRGSWPARA